MKHYIVVTSINPPTISVDRIAKGAKENDWGFVIAGDTKTPGELFAERTDIDFLDFDSQRESAFCLASVAREKSYTRKMFGYLHAMKAGATYIIDTDDDNWPKEDFFIDRDELFGRNGFNTGFLHLPTFTDAGWLNIYRYFAPAANLWPRGFPLSLIGLPLPVLSSTLEKNNALVLQGLADGAPDIDAVHRFVYPGMEFLFEKRRPIQLTGETWCPFNSQNTTWAPEAFFMMYLPATCSFRMTDIYRGYITQRILKEINRSIVYHDATVHHDRNEHQIISDFKDEVMNYCDDGAFISGLAELALQGLSKVDMLRRCYEFTIEQGYCTANEREILEAWITDCTKLGAL